MNSKSEPIWCPKCNIQNDPSLPLCAYCNFPLQASSGSPLDVQVGGGHYKNLPIQPVEYCQRNKLGFCESSVVKYVTRHREKNGAQDIKKAIHFLELLLQLEYDQATPKHTPKQP